MYAAGKIPGGFIKRESRPSDRATLTARMTDRPIRPLWPKGYRNETQVVATVLSVDQVNAFDILCINGASAALMLSELPFPGPVGAVRIGLIGDEFIINPTLQESEESELDLVVAGTAEAISMVEAGAKEVDEETMLEALQIAHEEIRRLCAVAARAARRGPASPSGRSTPSRVDEKLLAQDREGRSARTWPRPPASRPSWPAATRSPPSAPPPPRRSSATTPTPEAAAAFVHRVRRAGEAAHPPSASPSTRSAPTAARPTRSGRSRCEVRVLPRVHGSGLFTRGETQVLTSLALGTTKEAQRIDGLGIETTQALHPPLQLPALQRGRDRLHARPQAPRHRPRRARRAGPAADDPGRGGVPLHAAARLRDAREQRVVVDGVGLRLDPRAAGRRRERSRARWPASRWASSRRATTTSSSPTSRATRTTSATWTSRWPGRRRASPPCRWTSRSPASPSRSCATRWRRRRPGASTSSGSWPRRSTAPATSCRPWAPRITAIKIDPERIGTVIGKGGETIRGLEADYEVEISIEDDGTVKVYGVDGQKADAAVEQIRAMTKDVEVGDTYLGAKVVKTTTFGAFVELTKGVDGLLHISNLGRGRVDKVEDVVNRGDTVDVTRRRGRQGPRPHRPAHRRHGGRRRRRGRQRRRRGVATATTTASRAGGAGG